jgi:hypothetical protein
MSRAIVLGLVLLAVTVGWVSAQQPAQPAAKFVPKLEPVAETRLLMEGLNQSNFRGLERLLKQKPADVETWTFARGQALLIAETGNLLMLRPPKNNGQDAWMRHATDLRDAATDLARTAANRDYERSRAGLTRVANACNRCHQTFRVPVQIAPFAEPAERKVGLTDPEPRASR